VEVSIQLQSKTFKYKEQTMYTLLENNQIIAGPNHWSKNKFQGILTDDYEITFGLPQSDPGDQVFIINDSLKLLPVVATIEEAHNPKIEELAGPFVTITNNQVTLNYTKVDKNIDAVKANLKSTVADNRWKLETAGVKVTIQGQELSITTARGERDIYLQALQLGSDAKTWKFDTNTWIVLSLAELQTIVTAIVTHIQEAFDWEAALINTIDSSTDLASLDAITLLHPSQVTTGPNLV